MCGGDGRAGGGAKTLNCGPGRGDDSTTMKRSTAGLEYGVRSSYCGLFSHHQAPGRDGAWLIDSLRSPSCLSLLTARDEWLFAHRRSSA